MQQLSKASIDSQVSVLTALSLLSGLPRVMWFIRFHMRRNRHAGLSIPQFRTLAQLHALGSINVSCVADNLGCSLPTASRMVDKLVIAGLVDRAQCTDNRRKVSLCLTAKGLSAYEAASRGTAQAMAQVLSSLSEKDHQDITRLMARLKDLFEPQTCLEKQCSDDRPSSPRAPRKLSARPKRSSLE